MSWSIYLSGSRDAVLHELEQAIHTLSQARSMGSCLDNDNLTVSAGGSAYQGTPASGMSANISVNGADNVRQPVEVPQPYQRTDIPAAPPEPEILNPELVPPSTAVAVSDDDIAF